MTDNEEPYYGAWAGWDDKRWIELDSPPESMSRVESTALAVLRADAKDLTARALAHIREFIAPTHPVHQCEPDVNDFSFRTVGSDSIRVRIEFYFPLDDNVFWWLVYNVPYVAGPFPTGERAYYPIGWGRHVE